LNCLWLLLLLLLLLLLQVPEVPPGAAGTAHRPLLASTGSSLVVLAAADGVLMVRVPGGFYLLHVRA
jgi:hypothetical protein